jgi:ketosteroid isomerase-like protein
MRRIALCMGFVAAAATTAGAQGRAQAGAQTGAPATAGATASNFAGVAAQAIMRLEDAWAAALVKRDGATFERLLAPGFVYTENDKLMARPDVIHDVVAGTDTVRSATNEKLEVRLFGETGIATGWLIVAGRGKGGAFEHRYRFTDTWVRHGDSWQIVAAQDYLAPPKKK